MEDIKKENIVLDMEIVDGVVVKYNGNADNINIPEGVTKIGNDAFKKSNIKRVLLPKSLEIIGSGSFGDCVNLEYINIPSSLRSVRDQAFYGCSKLVTAGTDIMCNMQLDPEMTKIPERLFFNCVMLESVVLPKQIKVIEKEAFWNCKKLERIRIPSSCERIENGAFNWCSSLKKLKMNSKTITIEGNAFKHCDSMADKAGFVVIDHTLYSYCGNNTVVTIPRGVKKIAADAFCDTGINFKHDCITEIIVPKSVTSIGDYAFSYCENLKKVTIPDSVHSIGMDIFSSCTKLERLVVGNNALPEVKQIADEITAKYRKRKELEENLQKKSDAKTVIRREQDLLNAVSSFVKRFSANKESAELIVHYISAKLFSEIIYSKGNWYFYEDKMEYIYEWSAHSFFDDGGGEESLVQWTFESVICENAVAENDKLTDLDEYTRYDGSDESFICQDPFGLQGTFKISYRSYHEYTD